MIPGRLKVSFIFFFSCSRLQNLLCPNMGWEVQETEYWQSGIKTHTHFRGKTCDSGLILSSRTRIGCQTQPDVCLPCCVVLGANKDKQNNQSKQVMRRQLPGAISHQQDGGVPSGDGVPAAQHYQRQRFWCSAPTAHKSVWTANETWPDGSSELRFEPPFNREALWTLVTWARCD